MTDPIALIRAALEAAVELAEEYARETFDGDPTEVRDYIIDSIDPAAILRRVQEGQHGQG